MKNRWINTGLAAILFFCLLAAPDSSARPAIRGDILIFQPDGTSLTARLRGDIHEDTHHR